MVNYTENNINVVEKANQSRMVIEKTVEGFDRLYRVMTPEQQLKTQDLQKLMGRVHYCFNMYEEYAHNTLDNEEVIIKRLNKIVHASTLTLNGLCMLIDNDDSEYDYMYKKATTLLDAILE